MPEAGAAAISTLGAALPGGSVTVMATVSVPVLPASSVTVTVAVYGPGVMYV